MIIDIRLSGEMENFFQQMFTVSVLTLGALLRYEEPVGTGAICFDLRCVSFLL